MVDLIHVLEYPCGAPWCFFDQADPAAYLINKANYLDYPTALASG